MGKGHVNVEIKAACSNPENIRRVLLDKGAEYKGRDHQIDTYFKTESGRLKVREGNIENSIIYYERSNKKGPKKSDIIMVNDTKGSPFIDILRRVLDKLAVVDKKRDIFFIGNVKFHIDNVKGLGSFVEIEAIDYKGNIGEARLKQQAEEYLNLFGIKKKELVSHSYSDMLIEEK